MSPENVNLLLAVLIRRCLNLADKTLSRMERRGLVVALALIEPNRPTVAEMLTFAAELANAHEHPAAANIALTLESYARKGA